MISYKRCKMAKWYHLKYVLSSKKNTKQCMKSRVKAWVKQLSIKCGNKDWHRQIETKIYVCKKGIFDNCPENQEKNETQSMEYKVSWGRVDFKSIIRQCDYQS